MIDIQLLRDQPDIVKAACRDKNAAVSAADIDHLIEIDARRRELLSRIEELRRERNEIADAGRDNEGGRPAQEQIARGKELKIEVAELENKYAELEAEFYAKFREVPNLPSADVPVGATEDENVVASHWGEARELASSRSPTGRSPRRAAGSIKSGGQSRGRAVRVPQGAAGEATVRADDVRSGPVDGRRAHCEVD